MPHVERRVGFTGTREGMTDEQRDQFTRMVIARNPAEFHHGDCIGADAEAHAIVREYLPRCTIEIHPPTDPTLRAWCKGDRERAPEPYLDRNRHIVDAVDELLAVPYEARMQRRSGTWATVRYAKGRTVPCLTIDPAGNVGQP